MPPKGSRGVGSSARSRTPRCAAATSDQGPSDALKQLKALLLGLERRPDRRQRCEEMLAKEVPWLQVEFFPATDGKAQPIPDDQVAQTWNTKNNSLYGSYEDLLDKDGKLWHSKKDFEEQGVEYMFSPGERGCAHSHYRMWQRAAEASGPTLVLEDDVQLVFERSDGSKTSGQTFMTRLELGMQEATKRAADVLYLGWAGYRDGNFKHMKAKGGRKSNIMRKAEYVWTTVAYVIWPTGAKKLLAQAKPMNQPVDNFMAWECREGRLDSFVLLDETDTDDTYSGGIVTQVDFANDSDIKKSDGGDQNDDATVFLAHKPEGGATAAAAEDALPPMPEATKADAEPAEEKMLPMADVPEAAVDQPLGEPAEN